MAWQPDGVGSTASPRRILPGYTFPLRRRKGKM